MYVQLLRDFFNSFTSITKIAPDDYSNCEFEKLENTIERTLEISLKFPVLSKNEMRFFSVFN